MAEKFGIKYEDSKVKKQGGLDQEILEWIQEKEGGIANEYLYFNECSISEKGIQVIVKDNKDTVIIFSPSLVLEKCQKENEYDQIVLIAKQLQEMFPKICGVDKYQYDINGGDYTIDGRQKWRIAFVLKKESVEEKNIINYNFHRIEVSLDENNNVYSITIHNENLNNKNSFYFKSKTASLYEESLLDYLKNGNNLVIESSYDGVLCEYDLLIASQFLIHCIGNILDIDVSKPCYSDNAMKIYFYKGEL